MSLHSGLYDKFFPNKKSILFTFSFENYRYAVIRPDDLTCECAKVKWSLWSGFFCTCDGVSDEAVDIANRILQLHENAPDKYALQGEHYGVSFTRNENERKMRITLAQKRLFSGRGIRLPAVIRFLFSVLLALIVSLALSDTAGEWLRYLTPLPELSASALKAILYTAELVCTVLFLFLFRETRSPAALCFNAMLPLQTVILLGVMKKWFLLALLVPFAFAVIYHYMGELCDFSVFRSMKKQRLLQFRNTFLIIVISTTFAASISYVTPYDQSEKAPPPKENGTTAVEIPEDLPERYYNACYELYEEDFEAKTPQEKLDILQTICDYECLINFGCPSSPRVIAGETKDENVLGYYNNDDRTVTIRSGHVAGGSTDDVLNTLLHEVRHHIQYRMIDLYCALDPHLPDEYRGMSPFKEAVLFMENFQNYTSGTEDFDSYYDQIVESDSRAWARERMRWYDSYIYGLGDK